MAVPILINSSDGNLIDGIYQHSDPGRVEILGQLSSNNILRVRIDLCHTLLLYYLTGFTGEA